MANSGIKEIFFSYFVHPSSLTTTWILDSGSTDHMTLSYKYFSSYDQIFLGMSKQPIEPYFRLPALGQ